VPISQYDSVWGHKPGSAAKAKAAMVKQYGTTEGTRIFHATTNERKAKGKGNALMDAISRATKSRKLANKPRSKRR